MANVSLGALEWALSEVDFPADKDAIVRQAEQRGADDDVRRALRSLQPVAYGSAKEVIRSVHPEVGSGAAESRHADPDNKPGKPGITERLR